MTQDASAIQLIASLDDDQLYTVWLDGVTPLFRAPGSQIKAVQWSDKTADRLRFSFTAWHHKT